MRGEYSLRRWSCWQRSELPPHARRIRRSGRNFLCLSGTTSACAENTKATGEAPELNWNYLRMRGEYPSVRMWVSMRMELPPHARRIQSTRAAAVLRNGTTSACAENTHPPPAPTHECGNYLRMRGEYHLGFSQYKLVPELPPHARRIQRVHVDGTFPLGTTSACAENTSNASAGTVTDRNYLRMRGEYRYYGAVGVCGAELPPHARRILDY